jgi:hypothetical protein
MPSEPAFSAPNSDTGNRQDRPAHSVWKRALLGVMLLFIMASGGAWLLHASIEAEADEAEISASAHPAR